MFELVFLGTDAAKLEAQADVFSDATGDSDLRGTAEIKSIIPKGQSSILSEMTVNDSQSFTCTSTTQYVHADYLQTRDSWLYKKTTEDKIWNMHDPE